MAPITDFRISSYNPKAIDNCGRFIGHQSYWKLYAIENLFRIIVHSILSVQISYVWWEVAVDGPTRTKAEYRQSLYSRKSPNDKIGRHGIYYLDLRDLNEIIRANANLIDPVVPDLDSWILSIEDLRLPRNVVAHMNFPTRTDINRIDSFYDECQRLISQVQTKVELKIP